MTQDEAKKILSQCDAWIGEKVAGENADDGEITLDGIFTKAELQALLVLEFGVDA